MMEILTPYLGIALKLVTGMIGILVFLRLAGKAQMAQITPLDTVSAFVIGALVGGVLYNPTCPSGTSSLLWRCGRASTCSCVLPCARHA